MHICGDEIQAFVATVQSCGPCLSGIGSIARSKARSIYLALLVVLGAACAGEVTDEGRETSLTDEVFTFTFTEVPKYKSCGALEPFTGTAEDFCNSRCDNVEYKLPGDVVCSGSASVLRLTFSIDLTGSLLVIGPEYCESHYTVELTRE